MPKRGDKPRRIAPVPPTDEALDGLLDQLEDALLAGEHEIAEACLGRLAPSSRRLPDVLARRLAKGRARVPELAMDMLTTFAGSRALTLVRRLAKDTAAPDAVRFAAQRRAGWPERGEAKRRRAFLDTWRDAEGTLLGISEAASIRWPPESTMLEEVLGYLRAWPAPRTQAFLRRTVAELGPHAVWLLHACLHLPDAASARLAVEELARLRFPGSTAALDRLAYSTRDQTLAHLARSAADLLRTLPIQADYLPPVERVHATMVDGDGGQGVMVVRRWTEDFFLLADFLVTDDAGVKGVFGMNRVAAPQLEEMELEHAMQEVAITEIDLTAARAIVAGGLAVNAARRQPLPPEFELWEPLLHDDYPPSPEEPLAVVELDDAPYAGRTDLLRRSRRLADHGFFRSWGFPEERMEAAMLVTPEPRGARLTDTQFRPLVRHLLDEPTRARLRARLRRQAWLLDQDGDTPARDLALATAAVLAEGDERALIRLPLVRAMLERGVAAVLAPVLDPFTGVPVELLDQLDELLGRGQPKGDAP